MSSTAEVPDNIRQRVIAAAEALWDESGRGEKMPTVDQVRRRAGCDMNSTTLVVREWKRLQGAKPEPVAAPVPEPVMAIFAPVVAAAWDAAQDLANASLRAAQADWELERKESEGMRAELSRLWQAQDEELEQLRTELSQSLREKEAAEQANVQLQGQIRELDGQLADQRHETAQANARTEEIERKASDLKEQLGIAHGDLKEVREELKDARAKHADAMKELETASASELDKAHSAHAMTQGRLNQVSEDLARLQESHSAVTLELRSELATALATLKAAQDTHQEQRQQAVELAQQQTLRFNQLQQERDSAVTEAAHVRGQLESQQAQTKELMQRLDKPRTQAKPGK